jgi:hypothetical protein
MPPTTIQKLRRFALKLPDTTEGTACAGTALETTTVQRKQKAFLFLRAADLRLKLSASLAQAAALADEDSARYTVGAHGWVSVKLMDSSDDISLLQRWIEESHALMGSSQRKGTKPKK